MNIKQLKELIKDLPDEALIVTDASDHSFSKAEVMPDTILVHKNKFGFIEHMEEDFYPLDEPEQDEATGKVPERVKALIIR